MRIQARSDTIDGVLNAVNCYYEGNFTPPSTKENMVRLRQLISGIIDHEGKEMRI